MDRHRRPPRDGRLALIYQVTPHIQARFVIWLHALDSNVYNDKHGSYQIVQGLFGMGSGGLFGTGLGQGYPTKVYAANSDSSSPPSARRSA